MKEKNQPSTTIRSYPALWFFGFFALSVLGSIGFSSIFPSYTFEIPFLTKMVGELETARTFTVPIPIMVAVLMSGLASAFLYIAAQSGIFGRIIYGGLGIASVLVCAAGDGMSAYQLMASRGGDIYNSRQAIAVSSSFKNQLDKEKQELEKMDAELISLHKEHAKARSLYETSDLRSELDAVTSRYAVPGLTSAENSQLRSRMQQLQKQLASRTGNEFLIVEAKAALDAKQRVIDAKRTRIELLSKNTREAESTENLAANTENIFLQVAKEATGTEKQTDTALAIGKGAAIVALIPETGIALLAWGLGWNRRVRRERNESQKPDKKDDSKSDIKPEKDPVTIPDIFKNRLNSAPVSIPVEEMNPIASAISTPSDQVTNNEPQPDPKVVDQDVIIQRITEPTGIDKERRDVRKLNKTRKLDRYYKSEEISRMSRKELKAKINYAVVRAAKDPNLVPMGLPA